MTAETDTSALSLEDRCIRAIQFLAVDGVQKANSGHPGMPMEASALAYALWTRHLTYDPSDSAWPNRDRFILSAGHGSMLLYSMLHLTGYGLTLDDLRNFRQWESNTPGHPERGCTPGVETTTGPLGQGFATGVGLAMAGRYLGAMFNRPGYPIVDYRVYSFASDGAMMEGVASEAASFAGRLGMGNLIYVYLDNKITIEGSTDITFTEDVGKRFEAYGWHVQRIDGYDQAAMDTAFAAAKKEVDRPSLIIARTCIGCGCATKEGSPEVHGAPLGEEEVTLTKQKCDWPLDPTFYVPDDVKEFFLKAAGRGKEKTRKWNDLFRAWRKEYPDLAEKWDGMHKAPDMAALKSVLPVFTPDQGSLATRSVSGQVVNALAPKLPGLIGGSADLAPSNNTYLKKFGEFQKDNGPNIHFGVREHAMAAALNGMALSGALIPYGGTFLVFADYMRGAMRLAALMELPVIYVLTHDSIGLGEDGPTHQPIEHVASLRAMPNMTVIRPGDANETVEGWRAALLNRKGPTALLLTRQGLPVVDRNKYGSAEGLHKGAYVLADASDGSPDVILMATGSEVQLILDAYEKLTAKGIRARAVSMPCWELFEAQSKEYRDSVLPPKITARVAVEAAAPFGWHRYVGLSGVVIAMDHFGASAPAKILFRKFGFTVENIIEKAESLL